MQVQILVKSDISETLTFFADIYIDIYIYILLLWPVIPVLNQLFPF